MEMLLHMPLLLLLSILLSLLFVLQGYISQDSFSPWSSDSDSSKGGNEGGAADGSPYQAPREKITLPEALDESPFKLIKVGGQNPSHQHTLCFSATGVLFILAKFVTCTCTLAPIPPQPGLYRYMLHQKE